MAGTLTAADSVPRDTVSPKPLAVAPRRRWPRRVLMLGGIAVVAAASLGYWLQGGRWVSIDNAYVRADKLVVSTDVSGLVAEVPVREGQAVRAGDVLFRLDDRQFRIALAGAKARLEQTRLMLEAGKADYQRMLRDVASKQAQVGMDQARFDRYNSLVRGGDVARQEFDDVRYRLVVDQQAVESAKLSAQVQLAKLAGDPDIDPAKTPDYMQAASQVAEAQRQLDHAVVLAPFPGVVTNVSTLQPGTYLLAGTGAFGLVSSSHVWVDANPKETELTWVKPGDNVEVAVDTYPGRTWSGVVESISPASGSEFSILPAQNSSGNWVKVVQRIPLRVRVEQKPGDPALRSGMSAVVEIDSGHVRSLADLY